jgi:branched-chain amino acid aminotransferase
MPYVNQHAWIYQQGAFRPAQTAQVDLFGQSLHYGVAAIEGIRAYNTHNGPRLFKAKAHFERLEHSTRTVGLPFTWEIPQLIELTYALLQKNNLRNAYVRPLVLGGQSMFLTPSKTSDLVLTAWEWGPFLGSESIRVTISRYRRPDPKSFPVDTKLSGSYLPCLLATTEAQQKGFDEALLLDQEGYLGQASTNNIFIEKDGQLFTPPLGQIFPGITRRTVIDIAKALNIPVLEKKLTLEDLTQADSAFLTGTATGIVGIKEVDHTAYPEEWSNTLGASIQRAYKSLVTENENFEVII